MRPGLSGIGSVVFRDEELHVSKATDPVQYYHEKIHPVKGALEKWYYQNRSLYVDSMIVFLTCWVILFPHSKLVYRVFDDLPRFEA